MKVKKNKYKGWTNDLVEELLSLYGTLTTVDISKKINKSLGSIYYILNKENIDLKLSYWTNKEIDVLEEKYSKLSNQELRQILFRSEDAIQLKAASLGLTKDLFWSENEIKELHAMKLAGISYSLMSEILHKSESSIHNKLIEQKLTHNIKRWTDKEINLIEVLATSKQYTYVDIANKVHSTPEQVTACCYYRGWNQFVLKSKSRGEEQLVLILKDLFNLYEILQEFHIGDRQRLDIFIPELNLAFEFDGEQHFKKIAYFHMTDNDLSHIQYLDELKDKKCLEYGISLIRIRFDEELNSNLVLSKIKKIGYGNGSIELDDIKLTDGYLSEYTKNNKIRKEKISQYRKESRQRYLSSDGHEQALKKAKEYRREQYKRMKELKDAK
jgi:hypothetical protein